jgi:hypothetical protein
MSVAAFDESQRLSFTRGLASLFRNGVIQNITILNVRAGSVIIDTEITTSSTAVTAAVAAILVNPDALMLVGFGTQLSAIILPADSTCTPFTSTRDCSSGAGCGWCVRFMASPPRLQLA